LIVFTGVWVLFKVYDFCFGVYLIIRSSWLMKDFFRRQQRKINGKMLFGSLNRFSCAAFPCLFLLCGFCCDLFILCFLFECMGCTLDAFSVFLEGCFFILFFSLSKDLFAFSCSFYMYDWKVFIVNDKIGLISYFN